MGFKRVRTLLRVSGWNPEYLTLRGKAPAALRVAAVTG